MSQPAAAGAAANNAFVPSTEYGYAVDQEVSKLCVRAWADFLCSDLSRLKDLA